jgi:subtilisin family serine protease
MKWNTKLGATLLADHPGGGAEAFLYPPRPALAIASGRVPSRKRKALRGASFGPCLIFSLAVTLFCLLNVGKSLAEPSEESNRYAIHRATPNDEHYEAQEGYLKEIRLPQAWKLYGEIQKMQNVSSSNIVVAVLDTGMSFEHPEFADRILPGYDFIRDPALACDGDGPDGTTRDELIIKYPNSGNKTHGLHVAGIIAARGHNRQGIAGVNWNCKILPVRVVGCHKTDLGKTDARDRDIANGIRWAAGLKVDGAPPNRNAAKIINLSLGGQNRTTGTEA